MKKFPSYESWVTQDITTKVCFIHFRTMIKKHRGSDELITENIKLPGKDRLLDEVIEYTEKFVVKIYNKIF